MPDNHSLPVLPDPDKLSRILARAEERAAQHPGEAAPAPAPALDEASAIREKVIEVLKTIYDPEIPVNIYELGLVYDIAVRPDAHVYVRMTLTAPACPVAETLPIEVESKIQSIPEVASAEVELVWDPPWGRERMSEAALLKLGLM